MRILLGYPNAADEKEILNNLRRDHPIIHLSRVVEIEELLAILPLVWEVHLDESLQDYIVALIDATRRCNILECAQMRCGGLEAGVHGIE